MLIPLGIISIGILLFIVTAIVLGGIMGERVYNFFIKLINYFKN